MGTNYYALLDVCGHCRRPYKTLHVGKSSGGWTFSFRGYPPDDAVTLAPDGPETYIVSYKDWLDVLARPGVVIEAECGELVTLDDFVRLVESKKGAPNNQTLYCRSYHPEHAERNCWLDPEGHSFTAGRRRRPRAGRADGVGGRRGRVRVAQEAVT